MRSLHPDCYRQVQKSTTQEVATTSVAPPVRQQYVNIRRGKPVTEPPRRATEPPLEYVEYDYYVDEPEIDQAPQRPQWVPYYTGSSYDVVAPSVRQQYVNIRGGKPVTEPPRRATEATLEYDYYVDEPQIDQAPQRPQWVPYYTEGSYGIVAPPTRYQYVNTWRCKPSPTRVWLLWRGRAANSPDATAADSGLDQMF